MRVSTKLAFFALALALVATAPLAWVTVVRAGQQQERELRMRLRHTATLLASLRAPDMTLPGGRVDPRFLDLFVQNAPALGTNLAWAALLDGDGKLIEGDISRAILDEAIPDFGVVARHLNDDSVLAALFDRTLPLTDAALEQVTVRLVGRDGSSLGSLRAVFSLRPLQAQLATRRAWAVGVTLASLVIGLLGALLLGRTFTRPICVLDDAMSRVAAGDLGHRVSIDRHDELGRLGNAFNQMTKGLEERVRLRNTLARFVSEQVAARLMSDQHSLELRGDLKQVTVLFLDIRDFTTMSERLSPHETFELLNDYFNMIIEVIFRHEGTINKFIGDSIMAIYGAPFPVAEAELKAVHTAWEIQREVGGYNHTRRARGLEACDFGIGINSGLAIAGNVGSARRMEYTVIGDDVNLAQRIESQTRPREILISQSTWQAVRHRVSAERLEPRALKGISHPITIYRVAGLTEGSSEEVCQ